MCASSHVVCKLQVAVLEAIELEDVDYLVMYEDIRKAIASGGSRSPSGKVLLLEVSRVCVFF